LKIGQYFTKLRGTKQSVPVLGPPCSQTKTEASVQLDIDSKTISVDGPMTCHTTVSNSRWRHFSSVNRTKAQHESSALAELLKSFYLLTFLHTTLEDEM